MARNFYVPINLNVLELQNAVIGNLSTTSINGLTGGALSKGRIQFDSTLNVLKYYDGSAWQTVSSGGGSFTLGATSISLGATVTSVGGLTINNTGGSSVWNGSTIGVAYGGTGATTLTSNGVLLGNGTSAVSATTAGSADQVLRVPGAGGAPAFGAIDLTKTAAVTGALAAGNGGTGLSSYTIGDLIYASGTGTLSKLAVGTSSQVLIGGTNPAWGQVTLTTQVTGTLPVANGGTGTVTGSITGTGALTFTAGGTNTNVNLVPNGTGTVDVASKKITNLADPTSAQDAATKSYVDGVAAGLNAHDAVKYATTAALGTAGNLVGGTITTTYANGTSGVGATLTIATSTNWTAITIDGQSLTVGDRVLIKNQVTALQNGIYTVTTVGTVGTTTSFVFTRATDSDQTPELGQGDLTYVISGTSNGGNGFVQTAVVTAVGTSSVTWSQFSGASSTLAGLGLVTNGTNPNQLDINNGSTLAITSDVLDLATVTQSNSTTSTSATSFVSAHTVDSYGRVTGTVSGAVPFTALGTSTSTATATANSGTVTSARRVTGAGIGTGTSMVVNHGLGQWVVAQMYDTSGNLVDVDVLNAATSGGTTTFTFATSQTLTGFQYVIVG